MARPTKQLPESTNTEETQEVDGNTVETPKVEMNDNALSIISNSDGTLSVLKYPFDFKTHTFGDPEVIETCNNWEVAFFRFKVVSSQYFG